jgi:hypothetical protein
MAREKLSKVWFFSFAWNCGCQFSLFIGAMQVCFPSNIFPVLGSSGRLGSVWLRLFLVSLEQVSCGSRPSKFHGMSTYHPHLKPSATMLGDSGSDPPSFNLYGKSQRRLKYLKCGVRCFLKACVECGFFETFDPPLNNPRIGVGTRVAPLGGVFLNGPPRSSSASRPGRTHRCYRTGHPLLGGSSHGSSLDHNHA